MYKLKSWLPCQLDILPAVAASAWHAGATAKELVRVREKVHGLAGQRGLSCRVSSVQEPALLPLEGLRVHQHTPCHKGRYCVNLTPTGSGLVGLHFFSPVTSNFG